MSKNQFYTIRNQKGATPEIYIDGVIGGDADYTSFRNAILSILDTGVTRVKLVINSGGGSMIQGFAMYDLLKSKKNLTIEVEVIGMAASMAGILMLAASPGLLGIHRNASVMTHKASMAAAGSADDLRSIADYGDKLEAKAKAIVCERTGKKPEDVEEWFAKGKDKWFTAEEAVAEGICDYIIEGKAERPTKMTNEAEMYGFYNSITKNQKQPIKMNKVIAMLTAMSIQHNLTENSTEEEISNVFKAAMAAKDTRIADLENQLKAGAKEKAVALIDAAVAAGKIKADTKDKMVEKATEDYDGVKLMLDSITGRVDINAHLEGAKGGDKGGKGGEGDERTFSQHSEDELAKMQKENPDKFNALRKAEYGV